MMYEKCVVNNGFSTGFFKLQRGKRQGDRLSPYLFILMFEVLFSNSKQKVSSWI